MNIRFPDSTSGNSKVDNSPVRKSSTGKVSPGNAGAAQGTEFSFSRTGVQALTAQLANLPDVRKERVQALQQAVESGSYQPSNQEIANAIHSDLFGAGSTGS
ncbi:MAG: flagellar biosynthesis anti-sigma factor FlgM [Terriglobia bacterium]